ncbi:MAG: hypothetical protein IJJ11_04535 [Methanosphaera sp.]|nr:hypothetical protein [Methanosphaera sp.]
MACMSVAVAADAGDSTEPVTTPAVTSTADNVDVQTVAQADNEITKKLDNNIDEEINYEENTRATTHNLDDNNFDEYITDSGLSSTVNEGDILNFTSDVTRTTSSYIINKPINIIGNGFTLDLKLIIGEYSNVTNNTFKNSVTIGRYANINDNTFTTPITINEYSNVTNNKFNSTVTLKNNINFKNNNAENSIVNVNGANCDLCGNKIYTLVVSDSANPTYVCYDNIFTIPPFYPYPDTRIQWYIHGSRSNNLNKNYLRSVKTSSVTDGIEYNEVDIDDEETFLKYFRYLEQGGLYLPVATYITGNTRYKLGYFPENGKVIYFMSNMLGQYMQNHFSIVGKDGFTLNNVGFYIVGLRVSISNLNLNYNLEDEENPVQPFSCQYFGMPDGYIEFDNLNITVKAEYKANYGVFGIGKAQAYDNVIIQNSIINVEVPAESYRVIDNKAPNTKILNNTINIKETYSAGENPNIIAILGTVDSSLNMNSTNVTCIGNTITLNGESTLTGIKLDGNTNTITDNTITVTSTEATATGVELTGNDNTVTDNYIVANDKAGNDAVTVTGENNIVENNIGTADTCIATSIELTYDTNPIDVGDRLIIRGVFKANKVESESSDIKVYDNDELIATTNSDEFGTITYAYTPTASGSHNLTFVFEGNDTHKDASSSITVEVNEVIEPEKEYSLKVDTTEFIQGETTTIKASIYYGNENEEEIATNITKGKVTFKVNGKTLKDLETGKVIYAKVVNGTATIENYLVPDTWDENTMIQAVYSGSSDVEKMTSEKTNITITPKQLTLLTEDTTATTGSTVTLTATLSDNTINNGKIVFKINGKTVKDTNGKVIYAKVANGTVSVEYNLPANMKAGSYTITAVYVSSDYPKLEDNKTLTIN